VQRTLYVCVSNPCFLQEKARNIKWNGVFLFQMWLSGMDTVGWTQVWASDEGSALKPVLESNICIS